jgi:hypothetical protein
VRRSLLGWAFLWLPSSLCSVLLHSSWVTSPSLTHFYCSTVSYCCDDWHILNH